MTSTNHEDTKNRTIVLITLLAGVWLFFSAWVFHIATRGIAYNSWLVGAIIAIVAAVDLTYPTENWLSWINCLLAIWTFASPWIFAYTEERGLLFNSLAMGAIVFIGSVWNALSPHPSQPLPHGS